MIGFATPRAPRRFGRLPGGWKGAGLALALGFAVVAGCNDSGGTGTTPDYTITLNPTALTILPGAADVTTVTLDRTDFDGEIALTVTGNPAGMSASFAPQATTGNSSVLTIGVSPGTSPGLYPVTVRGNAAPGSHARLLSVTVAPPLPNFELSIDPSHLTIPRDASATTGVIVTRTDFTGPVTLTLTGAPAGVVGSFDPAAPTGTGSVLTVNVSAGVVPGNYDVTVEGTGAPGTRSASFFLTVTP